MDAALAALSLCSRGVGISGSLQAIPETGGITDAVVRSLEASGARSAPDLASGILGEHLRRVEHLGTAIGARSEILGGINAVSEM